ncbi:MAG: type IV pilin protein [Endozoicomonas sp.]
MKHCNPVRQKGYNLLELLAVLTIIGILAAIVLPGFSDYIRDARRNDGITFLLEIMQRQERYFTEELTYTSDLTKLGYGGASSVVSDNGFYSVTAAACTETVTDTNTGVTTTITFSLSDCVLLTAAPRGVQAGDGNLTLDNRGQRTPASAWP